MKQILVYDDTKTELEKIADSNDNFTANVVDALLQAIRDNDIDLSEYL